MEGDNSTEKINDEITQTSTVNPLLKEINNKLDLLLKLQQEKNN